MQSGLNNSNDNMLFATHLYIVKKMHPTNTFFLSNNWKIIELSNGKTFIANKYCCNKEIYQTQISLFFLISLEGIDKIQD